MKPSMQKFISLRQVHCTILTSYYYGIVYRVHGYIMTTSCMHLHHHATTAAVNSAIVLPRDYVIMSAKFPDGLNSQVQSLKTTVYCACASCTLLSRSLSRTGWTWCRRVAAVMASIDPSKVAQLREFVRLCQAKPTVLHLPELTFFRDWLLR